MRDDFEYSEKSRGQSRARGQSHARGAASRSGHSSTGSHSSGYTGPRSSGSHSSYAGGSRSTAGTGSRTGRSTGRAGRRGSDYGRRSQDGPNMKLVLGAVLAFLIVGGGLVFAVRGGFVGGTHESSAAAEETTQNVLYTDTDTIHKDITLDLRAISPDAQSLNLNGMNREAVKQAIHGAYSWNLVVKNANPSIDSFKMPDLSVYDEVKETETSSGSGESDNDGSVQKVAVDNPYASVTIRPEAKSFTIPDLIGEQVDAQVDQIFTEYAAAIAEESATASAGGETSGEAEESTDASGAESETESTTGAGSDYTLTLPDMSAQISDYMKQLAIVWKMSPKNGDITSYDKESGEFVFGGSVAGYAVNAEATAQKVMASIGQHVYDATIECEGEKISASDSSIKDLYGTIGSFTTKTTSNATRNKNVKLAAAAINGTVLQPGEEFSFNKTVGQRTEAKGYGAAGAYNNGEVVQEIGGGVCQVSSTLYNAVFRSGLTTTYRRSHTFAPTYVTPGADATVSYPGPDYQFINNSDHAIGIRAWYEDQTCTVQIYGVRVLPKGESWELVCEKTTDLPVPAPKIITPEEGAESAGSAGSEWQAYKVIHKADGTTEKVKDHTAHYSGHTPKQYAPGTTESTAESSIAESGESTAESGSTAESTIAENGSKPSTGETKPSPAPETSPAETAKKPEAPTPETSASNHEVIEAPGAQEGPDDDEIIQDGP
ncbi:VanW family protein [Oribacterium sp. HCP3S3_B9]|uniref:VanW family protein n=1 Tax=Oribacterium sp. HCP3S3_B9 TaxID=3438946 RepID=UPI003F8AD9FE